MNKTMKRALAPFVLVAGVSSAVLMGVAPAHANGGGFKCVDDTLIAVANCVEVNPVVNVTIKNSPILSGNDISILENNLNNTKLDVQDIDATVLNFYNNVVKVPINVSDIVVKL